MNAKYTEVPRDSMPADLRFDTPPQNQGQIVEVSYADYPTCASEACHGAVYKRVHDRSDGTTAYYRRVNR